MPVGKAGSYPSSGAPEMCFTKVGPDLTGKYYIHQEKLATDKFSSLLRKFVNYGENIFITLTPGLPGFEARGLLGTHELNHRFLLLIWQVVPVAT
jgi:hypothetical protein